MHPPYYHYITNSRLPIPIPCRLTVAEENSHLGIAKGKINSGLPSTIDKAIPDAIKACTTGWKEDKTLKKRKFGVYTEEEYMHEEMGHSISDTDTYIHAAESMARNLSFLLKI